MPNKKTRKAETADGAKKRLNPKALSALLDCISHLVQGQLSFADEFGLGAERVLPLIAHVDDLPTTLHAWLREGPDGIAKLQQLFTALTNHQLALMSALDSVAEQAIDTLAPKPATQNFKKRLQLALGKSADDHSLWQELKTNQQLRYQQIIAPGFVAGYVRMRAELQGDKS